MDIRGELEDIKERLEDVVGPRGESPAGMRAEGFLQAAVQNLERALENVEQDYDVVVNVVVTVRVRANDEDDAADQAIEKIDNVLDTNGYYCDIERTEAEPAID